MKLIPLIAAVHSQVFNIPDLGDFDLTSFGLGDLNFGAPVEAAAPAAEVAADERYFFTTVTTTTTTTTTTTGAVLGNSCWKCDAMSYATCASSGEYQTCQSGDEDCCFVEIRETKQKLQQLCTGCKAKQACEDNRDENFEGINSQTYQCRPDYRQQRHGQRSPQQSVCRQCFNTCDPDVDQHKCFGSLTPITGDGPAFKLGLATNKAKYPWNTAFQGEDTDVFGIPTLAALDSDVDSAVIALIVAFDDTTNENTLNIYFDNAADGKVNVAVDAGSTRETETEMTFWSLQGADMAWWSSDLKKIQNVLNGWGAAAPFTAVGFNPVVT